MNHTYYTAGILITLGLIGTPAIGADMPIRPQIQLESKKGVEEQKLKLDTLRQSVNEDVKTGLAKVQQAIPLLENGKPDEALKLLKEAIGSFDIALAANPNLGLTPVGSVTQVQELYTDPATINRQVKLAHDLLDKGEVQAARAVLIPLRSDIAESVSYLPMATYPVAIRLAVKEITDGHIDQAKDTLASAMNTVVVANQRIVPIPVLAARSLVDEASKMDKSKKEDVGKKLSAAEDQLQMAQLLGYPVQDSPDYKQIKADINKLQAEVRGQNRVEKMYQDLNARISRWVDAMSDKLTK